LLEKVKKTFPISSQNLDEFTLAVKTAAEGLAIVKELKDHEGGGPIVLKASGLQEVVEVLKNQPDMAG
jgi:hypothetical protein